MSFPAKLSWGNSLDYRNTLSFLSLLLLFLLLLLLLLLLSLLLCRYQIGRKVVSTDDLVFGPGEGMIWIDELNCTTDDINIGYCAHAPWGVHDCHHEEDVAIICGMLIYHFDVGIVLKIYPVAYRYK